MARKSLLSGMLFLLAGFSLLAQNDGSYGQNQGNARFIVFSDPHYYDASLGTEGKAFEEYLDNDRKLLKESPMILHELVRQITASNSEFVLIPGDLTKDGTRISHEAFSNYLSAIEEAGKEVFVVPGNHDVSNPESFAYRGDEKVLMESVTADGFARIYDNYGYGEALYRDPASLSYIAMPVQGVWLLALDACRYEENVAGGHPVTGGRLKPETIQWFTNILQSEEAKSKRIIAMMHHGALEHYKNQKKYFGDYVVDDYKKVSKQLAELGINLVFTGHYHAQDIVKKDFPGGKVLYDIETGSLVTFPCPYRIITINSDQVKIEAYSLDPEEYPGEFMQYARDFVWSGIEGIARRTLVDMKLKEDEASLLSGQVSDAFIAHYQGDEIRPEKPFNLKGVGALGRFYISFRKKLVWSLYNDLPPGDNTLVIDLP
jgi:3',5'-cyclic AMP phosphodiesterase CpdA